MSVNSVNSGFVNYIFFNSSKKNNPEYKILVEKAVDSQEGVSPSTYEDNELNKQNNVIRNSIENLSCRKMTDNEISKFAQIIEDADKYQNPKEFLKTLSYEERDFIKRSNFYFNDLNDENIDQLSEEGAKNLLVWPDGNHFVDLNDDGIVEKGINKSIVFPAPNTPENVKKAWDDTLESFPEDQHLLLNDIFLSQLFAKNLTFNSDGDIDQLYHPGDNNYKNIFSTDTLGWLQLLDETSCSLDRYKNQDSTKDELKTIECNENFVELLRANIKKYY